MEQKDEQYSTEQKDLQQNDIQQNSTEQNDMKQNDIQQYSTEQFAMEPRKVLSRAGLSLSLMAAVILLSTFLIELFVEKKMPEIADSDWYVWAVTAITVVGIGLPTFFFSIKTIPATKKKEIVKLRFFQFVVLFFISMAALYISSMFGSIINFIITAIKGGNIINPAQEAILGGNLLISFVYAALVAPVVEEIIFRKLLLDKLRRFGDLPAILLSGFAFGLFHMNLAQFFYAAALGIIFAYITVRTNTIRYSILLHILINLTGATIAPLVIQSGNMLFVILLVTWMFTCVGVGILFFVLNRKNILLIKAEVPIVKKSIYFLNFGTILFTLICLVMTVRLILYVG